MPFSFLKRAWNKPPIAFPLVALFHLLITIHAFWTFRDILDTGWQSWLYPLTLLLYTIFWLLVCDLRKWAAYCYVIFMLADTLGYVLWPAAKEYTGVLFPASLIFGVLILIYFRKFE